MAPFQAPPNATRPMAIGDPYAPPVVPPPDPPDAVVTFPANLRDTLRGGLAVSFAAEGGFFDYPILDRSFESLTLETGFTEVLGTGATARPERRGLVLATGPSSGSSARVETDGEYDYGAAYAYYDIRVDVELLNPPTTGLAGPVTVAEIFGENDDADIARVRIVRDPSQPGFLLYQGLASFAGGVVIAAGAGFIVDPGPHQKFRLRLVRNDNYVVGYVGLIDGADDSAAYVEVLNTTNFPTSAGVIGFGVSNQSTAVRVRSRFDSFTFTPCAMIVPRVAYGGKVRLLEDVSTPSRTRISGIIPAALYGLQDLGQHDVDVFGAWTRTRLTNAFEYTLPDSKIIGRTALRVLQTPTDPEVYTP